MFTVPGVRAVDSDSVGLCWVFSQILDVAEDMAAAVLAHEVPQVCTKAHVCGRNFLEIPLADGDALEQEKAFAVDQIIPKGIQALGESW